MKSVQIVGPTEGDEVEVSVSGRAGTPGPEPGSCLDERGNKGTCCPPAQDRPYVMKNHILHEVPLLPTKYGGSREDNSIKPVISGVIRTVPMG
ncbi:hypothetical protein ACLKA6_018652 [Drosophila palustris]